LIPSGISYYYEYPQVIEKFIVKTQRALNATVRFVRTDNGTEFVNKTLDGWFESVGISHETSVPRSPQQNGVVERRNRTLMEAARTMLIFAKAPLFLWAEAVATACYTLNRSLVHTLHGKTYYELLKGKKPNLQYFRVFGSLCYPTNDYDDVGKLKAKADIGIFVGYAPTKKAYRIYNKRTRKIQETVHVAFDELTEGLTSVQTSSGLAPQQMTSVPNSTELELTALQSGRSRSALVKDPEPPSVPPTKKQVDDLFQWFDDDEVVPIPPVVPITPVNVPAAPAPENANGSPSTTVISEGAPAVTESLLPHQIPLPDTSDSDVETLFDHVDSNVFDTYNAPETDSVASSSNSVNIDVTSSTTQITFSAKSASQAHPLKTVLGISNKQALEPLVAGLRLCWKKFMSLNAKPTEMHLIAISVSFRYLKETILHGYLWYPKGLLAVDTKKLLQMLTMQDVMTTGDVFWFSLNFLDIGSCQKDAVADSISDERVSRQRAYKFKTDCRVFSMNGDMPGFFGLAPTSEGGVSLQYRTSLDFPKALHIFGIFQNIIRDSD
ncbi:retrovirus-related pol polyprotein from transposon TNT 1-94, partial [Tanacetum coccineum]